MCALPLDRSRPAYGSVGTDYNHRVVSPSVNGWTIFAIASKRRRICASTAACMPYVGRAARWFRAMLTRRSGAGRRAVRGDRAPHTHISPERILACRRSQRRALVASNKRRPGRLTRDCHFWFCSDLRRVTSIGGFRPTDGGLVSASSRNATQLRAPRTSPLASACAAAAISGSI